MTPTPIAIALHVADSLLAEAEAAVDGLAAGEPPLAPDAAWSPGGDPRLLALESAGERLDRLGLHGALPAAENRAGLPAAVVGHLFRLGAESCRAEWELARRLDGPADAAALSAADSALDATAALAAAASAVAAWPAGRRALARDAVLDRLAAAMGVGPPPA